MLVMQHFVLLWWKYFCEIIFFFFFCSDFLSQLFLFFFYFIYKNISVSTIYRRINTLDYLILMRIFADKQMAEFRRNPKNKWKIIHDCGNILVIQTIFLRASYVVEFVSDEYTKYRKHDMNFESNLTQLSDHICHLNTSSRRASEGERMILEYIRRNEYSHSISAEKIISFFEK